MAIFNLDHFPNVCRMCAKPKPDEKLIPIASSTLVDNLDNGSRTLLELLNELTFEVPKAVSESIPNAMCATCFAVFEFVIQYQQKMSLLLKFLIAFAKLKAGDETDVVKMFSGESCSLIGLIKELNLCNREEVHVQDLIEEYGRSAAVEESCKSFSTAIKTEAKLEESKPIIETVESKGDDAEYYNIEYIEDDPEATGKQTEEPQEATESAPEFLEEVEEEYVPLSGGEAEENLKPDEAESPKSKQKSRMLQCPYCKYRTSSQEMFQHHVDRHENPNDENPWKCSFANCSEAYPTKDDLLRHKKEIHSKYVCDICGMVLKHKYTLEIHLRRHNGDSKYPCQYCSASFFTSNELKLHMSVAHLNATDFQCNECGLAFKNKKSLALHEKTHSEQRSFHCDECNMAFKTSAHLRRHHNNVHKAIKFTCSVCSVSYGRKDKLRMHMEKNHNIQTYFPCEICLKSFYTAAELDEHTLHHENPKELECPTCLAAFFNRNEFDSHLCISYREDYVCCERDFKYHLQYNKHMFLAHGMKTNVRVKPAADQLLGAARASRKQVERCAKCEQIFPTRKLKKDHMYTCAAIGPQQQQQQQQQGDFQDGVYMEVEDDGQEITSLSYADEQQTFVVV